MKDTRARAGGPFRLTTPGDGQWTRLVPWVVVVPLGAIVVYLLTSGPLTATRVVPALGVGLAALVASGGAIASFAPGVRAWTRRTAIVTSDGITVARPGREPYELAFGAIGRIHTHPESTGLRIPPVVQLVTDFYGIDGRRVPELAVHHSSYRYAVRTTELNADGPAFLRALEDKPARLDAASVDLVALVYRSESPGVDGLSERAVNEAKAGRLYHALRAAERDARASERTSATLVRLSLVLAHDAVETARAGADDHPGHPMFAHYLAHAMLSDVGVSSNPGPVALAHRAELRAEARRLLEGLVSDPVYGEDARRELGSRRLGA